jgi:hypothetical protein
MCLFHLEMTANLAGDKPLALREHMILLRGTSIAFFALSFIYARCVVLPF